MLLYCRYIAASDFTLLTSIFTLSLLSTGFGGFTPNLSSVPQHDIFNLLIKFLMLIQFPKLNFLYCYVIVMSIIKFISNSPWVIFDVLSSATNSYNALTKWFPQCPLHINWHDLKLEIFSLRLTIDIGRLIRSVHIWSVPSHYYLCSACVICFYIITQCLVHIIYLLIQNRAHEGHDT